MFGDITDSERLAWQRRAVSCLDVLLKLAAKEHLPLLTWRIGPHPAVLGESFADPHSRRRADLEAWKAAISSAACRDPDFDREHASGAETRLTAGWEWLPVQLAPQEHAMGVHVTLLASMRAEEEDDGA